MYSNFEEIDYNLERLDLERQIAFERLKFVKDDYKDAFNTVNLLQSGAKYAGLYGIYLIIKKMLS